MDSRHHAMRNVVNKTVGGENYWPFGAIRGEPHVGSASTGSLMTRSGKVGILSVATERPRAEEAAMSGLKVYGVPLSRAYRVVWMATELGLCYENLPIHFADGSAKTPEYLAVNPNGRIPAIDDNGFKLWESMAINLYLAKKHGSDLSPKTMEDEAQA